MDFFEQQDRARRQTTWLIGYYILAVVGIIVSIYAVLCLIVLKGIGWDPVLFLGTAGGALTVILLGSLWKIAQLSQGGSAVALMLGGRPVSTQTTTPAERQLLNVVSEMAIASGLTCPEVYVLDHEDGINAFAAGKTPSHAVIGVTRGCMEKLSRDELQGVIGHEFSHILNGDMRLNLRLIGLLAGILLIAMIGYWTLRLTGDSGRSRRRDGKDGTAAILLFGLALLIIGYIGVFFAKLIKSAISRQREFLADASSVQFTRNPAGIGGALCKIAADAAGSAVKDPEAEEASHMFFCNGLTGFLSDAFSTHPPISERLRAIGFDPSQVKDGTPKPSADRPPPSRQPRGLAQAVVGLPFLSGPQGTARAKASGVTRPMDAARAAAQFGAVTETHVDHAEQVLAAMPQEIRDAANEPFAARAVVLAMLLSPDAATRQKQSSLIETQMESGTLAETLRMGSAVAAVPIESHVGVISLLMPALRQLSPASYETFRKAVGAMIAADGQTDIFEFALQKMLFRHLDIYFRHLPPPFPNLRSVEGVMLEISILLSALAHCGSGDPAAKRTAFENGAATLKASSSPVFLIGAECGIGKIDQALNKLAGLAPQRKKRVLDACFATAASDGTITVWEGELLRAIADTLDCPLPPFVVAPAAAG